MLFSILYTILMKSRKVVGHSVDTYVNGRFEDSQFIEPNTVYYSIDGSLFAGGNSFNSPFAVNTSTFGFKLDLDGNILSVSKDGGAFNIMTTNLDPTKNYYPYVALLAGRARANFGDSAFKFNLPSGYQPYGVNNTFAGYNIGSASIKEIDDIELNMESQTNLDIPSENKDNLITAGIERRTNKERKLINNNDTIIQDTATIFQPSKGRVGG